MHNIHLKQLEFIHHPNVIQIKNDGEGFGTVHGADLYRARTVTVNVALKI